MPIVSIFARRDLIARDISYDTTDGEFVAPTTVTVGGAWETGVALGVSFSVF
jgi:hypothetical protein